MLYSNGNDNFDWKIRSRILSFFLPSEEFSRLREGRGLVAEVLGPNRGPSSPACDPCGDHRAKIRVFQILRLTRS
jgi:hypothetical protein